MSAPKPVQDFLAKHMGADKAEEWLKSHDTRGEMAIQSGFAFKSDAVPQEVDAAAEVEPAVQEQAPLESASSFTDAQIEEIIELVQGVSKAIQETIVNEFIMPLVPYIKSVAQSGQELKADIAAMKAAETPAGSLRWLSSHPVGSAKTLLEDDDILKTRRPAQDEEDAAAKGQTGVKFWDDIISTNTDDYVRNALSGNRN